MSALRQRSARGRVSWIGRRTEGATTPVSHDATRAACRVARARGATPRDGMAWWPNAARSRRIALGATTTALALGIALWLSATDSPAAGAATMVAGLGVFSVVIALVARIPGFLWGGAAAMAAAGAGLMALTNAPTIAAATFGAAILGVVELGRWSLDCRLDVPGPRTTARAGHLVGMAATGWVLGTVAVPAVTGHLSIDPLRLGAAAAVIGAVVLVLRWSLRAPPRRPAA